MKFGGTSQGTPERMKSILPLVNDGDKNIVVLSAVSGTTNQLVEIGNLLKQGSVDQATSLLAEMEDFYHAYVRSLLHNESAIQESWSYIRACLNKIKNCGEGEFTEIQEKVILAQGELISTYLFTKYAAEQNIDVSLIPALEFMQTDENNEPDLNSIEQKLQTILNTNSQAQLYVTQGYICMNNNQEIDNLKRGGSDYTASIIGAVTRAQEIQIWTDIDGMQNNDPRYVQDTQSIKELSFDEAAELAYFGAKILHPSTILPAKQNNVPVRLKNTMNPTALGTYISNRSSSQEIKAIAAKDGITAIKIKSDRMLLAYGFMKKTFEIFEKYKTSVDTVTTSEVAVSLTIDDASQLPRISEELNKMATVEIDHNLSIICIVGDFITEKPGYLSKIFAAIAHIPIRMVSYGGSKNNVTILVESKDKIGALQALNKGLFSSHKPALEAVAI